MRATICESIGPVSPEAVAEKVHREHGFIYLRSQGNPADSGRYSFIACRPFLIFQAFGAQVELSSRQRVRHFGNPWSILIDWLARYELNDQIDWPFPLGGCFGFWGYDLKNFLEPKLPRNAHRDLDLPDCCLGFYDSLLVHDHWLDKTWIISTGLIPDGSRQVQWAQAQLDFWRRVVESALSCEVLPEPCWRAGGAPSLHSTFTRGGFTAAVEKALAYIRQGHIYQANLSQRLAMPLMMPPWQFYKLLSQASPAPYSAFFNPGPFQLASASPELFLRMSGRQIVTRPIKGTRPRSLDPALDARLALDLQTNPKELAELVMITDLLRNDLGKICEYGSVRVAELARLERFQHVHHLVSTVQGELRPQCSHAEALAAVFPGGSITGAPKIRAMEIIDELEPKTRGPYTGCLGYLGFNRESQLSILIRTAILQKQTVYFPVGAGIVADSNPDAEYEETLAKAAGFLALPLAADPLATGSRNRSTIYPGIS